MGQESDQLRGEIEETRARMGETVDAIGYKTDVKSRAGDWVSDKKDSVVGTVRRKTPDPEGVKQGARRGVRIAKENPFGLAIGGAAVGFLVGLVAPSTRLEDEKVGDVSDEVKERAKETGQEAIERGKQVAEGARESAVETAKEQGEEQSQEMASTLKENAQEVAKGSDASTGA